MDNSWVDGDASLYAGNVDSDTNSDTRVDTSYLQDWGKPVEAGVSSFRIGQAAAIEGFPADQQAIERNRVLSAAYDPVAKATADYYLKKKMELAEKVQQTLAIPDIGIEQVQRDIQKKYDEVGNEHSVISQELAAMDGYAPAGDSLLKREQAFQLKAANSIAVMTADTSFLSDAGDLLGMLVPFKGYMDTKWDIPTEVAKDPALVSIAADDLNKIIINFTSLSPEEKAIVWPALQKAVVKATGGLTSSGNLMRAQSILSEMLSPSEGESLRTGTNLGLAFDVATVVPVTKVASLAKSGIKGASELLTTRSLVKDAVETVVADANAVKLASNAGDNLAAAAMNTSALADYATAAAMNVKPTAAMLNAFPVDTEAWFKGVTDGLVPAEQAIMNNNLSTAAGFFRSMTSEIGQMRIGAISASDRKFRMDTFLKKLEASGEDLAQEGFAIDNLRIVEEGRDGFTWEYNLKKVPILDPANNTVVPIYRYNTVTKQIEQITSEGLTEGVQRGKVTWKLDDITGNLDQTADSLAKWNGSTRGLSGATWAVGGGEADYGRALTLLSAVNRLSAVTAEKMTKFVKWAYKPVAGITNIKARARVEQMLLASDSYINPGMHYRGRVFTKQELLNGIVTDTGETIRLTSPAEVEAYYRLRMFHDGLYSMQNDMARQGYSLEGFKGVRFQLDGSIAGGTAGEAHDFEVLAKPHDTIASAKMSAKNRPGYEVFDVTTGKYTELTYDLIEAEYAKGKRLVRASRSWTPYGDFAPGKRHFSYLFVKDSHIGELPAKVIPYKEGYITKINKGQYAVKQVIPVIKAGVKDETKTLSVRLFDSLDIANDWRKEQAVEFANRNNVTIEEALARYTVPEKHVGMALDAPDAFIPSNKTLFTGSRAQDDILYGVAGSAAERVGTLDAVKRYASHLAYLFPRNELRVRLEREWENTVRNKLPNIRVTGFNSTALPDDAMGKALGTMRRHFKEVNYIPSSEETAFQSAIQYTHDWLLNGRNWAGSKLGLSSKEALKSVLMLKSADPIQAFKNASTHLTMGTFNVFQIPLQASAMVVAMSRRWGESLAGNNLGDVALAVKFGIFDNIRHETVLGNALKHLVKKGDLTAVQADAYRAWARSGLFEGTLNNLERGVMATDGMGISMDLLRAYGNADMLPFKIGDRAARRVSFIKEYAHWAKLNPGKIASDEDIIKITKEVEKDLLELDPVYRAVWQGGQGTGLTREVLGMATQYMQVATHTIELLARSVGRGGFTRAEVGKIMLAQPAIFGAAGVPVLGMFAPAILRQFGVKDVSPEEAAFLNQGMLGVFMHSAFGLDVDISSRIAIGTQLNDFLREMMTSDDPVWKKALGAPGTTGSRILDAYKALSILFTGDTAGERELTKGEVLLALSQLLKVASSTRNLYKAYIMHNADVILDRHGNVLTRRDFSTAEEIAASLGVELSEISGIRAYNMNKKELQEHVTSAADTRVALMYEAIYVHKLDPEATLNIQAAIQLQDEMLPPAIKDKVHQVVANKIWKYQVTEKDKMVADFVHGPAADYLMDSSIVDFSGIMGNGNPIVTPLAPLSSRIETEE